LPESETNWFWIGVALTVPMALGVLAALPFWRKAREVMLGNVAGAVVIFAGAVALMAREYVELERLYARCLQADAVCPDPPGFFDRIAVYAIIAFAQVILLFSVSLAVERRVRRRGYAKEWR
jgi:hypothetical protein